MPQSIAAILPILSFLASTAGAGYVASVLFNALRARFPMPASPVWWSTLLYAPRYARYSVFTLSAVLSVACSAAIALLGGSAVNVAVDAAVAIVVNQFWHGLSLSDVAPQE